MHRGRLATRGERGSGSRPIATLPNVAFVPEDLCNREAILDHPQTRAPIDFDEAVGLVMTSVFHPLTEEECQAVAGLGTHDLVRVTSSSCRVAPTRVRARHWEDVDIERASAAMEYVHALLRSVEEIRRYFDGTELVRPFHEDDGTRDVVWSNAWMAPDPHRADPSGRWIRAGVALRP